MLKKFFLAGAASIALTGAAQAADIIEPTAYDWTGPYVGLQGGYAWGENDVEVDGEPTPALAVVLFPPEDGEIDIDGWMGGLHLGYLWQHDSFVFGVEGDGEFADIDGREDVVEFDDGPTIGEIEQEIDWLASLRLRAGFAWDRALFYATGGLAVGGVELSADFDQGDSESKDKTEWGWTVGGGVEYAFSDALSGRVEYRYTDLGKTKVSDVDTGFGAFDFEADNTFHAVRAGLSWHFGAM
ncbi:MAG: outer membrane protein [Parvibaculaceae bacterium]